MWYRLVRALLLVLVASVALPQEARGNGRYPATMSVSYQPGSVRTLFGSTFGLLVSDDDGATWQWTCEQSVGYGGRFDPVYAATAAGTLYAGTFDGLSISRDGGCTWAYAGGPLAGHWIGDVQIASDGAVWVSTTSGGLANDVFVSHDDGLSFTPGGLMTDRAWWKAIRVAPSNPLRVYVSGYQLADLTIDAGNGVPVPLLRRSDDGGQSWMDVPFDYQGESQLFIVGVSPDDANVVHARVDGAAADTFLRSTDGALSWSPVLTFDGEGSEMLAFTILDDADTGAETDRLIAGTATRGVRVSDDGGDTWTTPTYQPSMTCVGQRPSDGALYSCGANWNPDKFAIGRSTDRGDTWAPVVRFSGIAGELACPAGSGHAQVCSSQWPVTQCMFVPEKCDPALADAGVPGADAGNAGDGGDGGGGGGDCGCGVGLAAAFIFVPWPRRRARRRSFPPI